MKNLIENSVLKYLFLGGIGIFFAYLFAFSSFYEKDFKASLIEGDYTDFNSHLFIADYQANPLDTGTLNIRLGKSLNNLSALSFVLNYPAEKINFTENLQKGEILADDLLILKQEDNIKGEYVINLVKDDGFNLEKSDEDFPVLLKLPFNLTEKTQIGDLIKLSFSEVQAIKTDFSFLSLDTADGEISLEKQENSLRMLETKTLAQDKIQVFFNDFLVKTGEDPIISPNINIQDIKISEENGKSLIITFTEKLNSNLYSVNYKQGVSPIGNTKGALNDENRFSFFTVKEETEDQISLEEVTLIDNKTLEISFDKNIDDHNFLNPTKYLIKSAKNEEIKISNLEKKSARTLQVNLISPLNFDSFYFFIAQDFENISYNNIKLLKTEEEKEVIINTLNPETLTNKGGEFIVNGKNLDKIVQIKINNKFVEILDKKSNTLNCKLESLETGLYDVSFIKDDGNQILKEKFLTIQESLGSLQVISAESYASPQKVPNDNQTETTLWALVSDPRGVDDISQVSLDLRELGGSAFAPMKGEQEDGNPIIVDNKRYFYLKIKIPQTVKTSSEPKKIKVVAEDNDGNKAYGEISLTVTNNIIASEKPLIKNAYVSPKPIKRKGNFSVYADIEDLDGIQDIDRVTVNLSEIGLGPKRMILSENTNNVESNYTNNTQVSSEDNSENNQNTIIPNQRKQSWFKAENIIIPDTIEVGTYNLPITVSDLSGEESVYQELSIKIGTGNPPTLDDDRIKVVPRQFIPNNDEETFQVKVYVEDEDGIEDITAVLLDIQEIGGTSVNLKREGEIREGQKGAYFVSEELTVGPNIKIGPAQLDIYVYDKEGYEVKDDVSIKVTSQDEVGQAPEIDSVKSYTNPSSVKVNSEEKISFNVFVKNHEFAIDQVMLDLSNIAKYTGENLENCKGATDRLVCLKPALKEGTRGQWYTLSDIVLLPQTQSSMEPYRIKVIVSDEKGKTNDGYILLQVGDGTLPSANLGYPKVKMVISTAEDTLEVLFSSPIDSKKIRKGAFVITKTNDTSDTLAITKYAVNTDSTVVTLKTHPQEKNVNYTLIANADILGLRENKYTDNHIDFVGYNKRKIPPQLIKVKAINSNLVEAIFSEGLRPSSVNSYGKDFEIFTRDAKKERLKVSHVELSEDNHTVLISTEKQIPNQKYLLRVKNVISAGGVKVGGEERTDNYLKNFYYGIHKDFVGFKTLNNQEKNIFEAGDFNQDGKIDFTDFTIFSSVYGQNLNNEEENNESSEYQPTPLEKKPETQSIN
jgi:methionine-rich copper-binding protein CopC